MRPVCKYLMPHIIYLHTEKSYRAFRTHGVTFQVHARRSDAAYRRNRTAHARGTCTNGSTWPYSPTTTTNKYPRGRTLPLLTSVQHPCCTLDNNKICRPHTGVRSGGSDAGGLQERGVVWGSLCCGYRALRRKRCPIWQMGPYTVSLT